MTQPQQDPATDVGAALARLAEQTVGLQRQVNRLESTAQEQTHIFTNLLKEAEGRIQDLTDAKFVTYRTLIDSQAEKVALALDATEKAIGKAEVATSRAIEKAEIANADRFKAVNEFRGQLSDQASTFMPRAEALQIASSSSERIREMTETLPTLATRLEVQVMTDRYSERLTELNDRINRMEAHDIGRKDNKTGIYGALAAAVAVIAIIVFVANALSTT